VKSAHKRKLCFMAENFGVQTLYRNEKSFKERKAKFSRALINKHELRKIVTLQKLILYPFVY
jgi:hypothetical protein